MDIIVKKPTETEKVEMHSHPIWECDISEFDWYYDSEETCLLIEGKVMLNMTATVYLLEPEIRLRSPRDYRVSGRLQSLLRGIMCSKSNDWRYLNEFNCKYSFGKGKKC